MLKEYLIGTEVYDRQPSYHPSEDSIARSAARRLRSKLKEYYESVGKDDPVYLLSTWELCTCLSAPTQPTYRQCCDGCYSG